MERISVIACHLHILILIDTPQIAFEERELHYEENEAVSIRCTVRDNLDPPASFVWYHNGVLVTADQGYDLTTPGMYMLIGLVFILGFIWW